MKQFNEVLNYNHETGIFNWKVDVSNNVKAGSIAGTIHHSGYIQIRFEKKQYRAHRLAWLLFYGKYPNNFIDHINGIKNDNRICNLRDVTRNENSQNQKKAQKDSMTKILGVTFSKVNNKWKARIIKNKQYIHLGYFDNANDAGNAYLVAKRKLHSTCEI